MREAMLYERQAEGRVQCHLCPHACRIDDGSRGLCQVRENRAGTLYSLVYGRTTVQHVDPIEKKPLFHFHPGSSTYSLATHGCNFHCQYCTNWQVSQMPSAAFPDASVDATPEAIVAAAQLAGCHSLAYTYVEPTIFFEYADDIARLAHAAGLANVYKTNGFMSTTMLDLARPYLDAANVDLKTFRDATYQRLGGRLQPVLDSLCHMRALGIWLEVSTVVIPGVNDEDAELRDIAAFIAEALGRETPWHIARFFPAYQMAQVPPTPLATLHGARAIGHAAGLRYVYLGNVLEEGAQDTSCAVCGHLLIRRRGVRLLDKALHAGGCPACGTPLPGVGC